MHWKCQKRWHKAFEMIVSISKHPTYQRTNTATGTGYIADFDEKCVYFTKDGKVFEKIDFEKEFGNDADLESEIESFIEWLDSVHNVKFYPTHGK